MHFMDEPEECSVHKHKSIESQGSNIFRFGKNYSRVYTELYSMNMNIKMYETKMRIYKKGESKD